MRRDCPPSLAGILSRKESLRASSWMGVDRGAGEERRVGHARTCFLSVTGGERMLIRITHADTAAHEARSQGRLLESQLAARPG